MDMTGSGFGYSYNGKEFSIPGPLIGVAPPAGLKCLPEDTSYRLHIRYSESLVHHGWHVHGHLRLLAAARHRLRQARHNSCRSPKSTISPAAQLAFCFTASISRTLGELWRFVKCIIAICVPGGIMLRVVNRTTIDHSRARGRGRRKGFPLCLRCSGLGIDTTGGFCPWGPPQANSIPSFA